MSTNIDGEKLFKEAWDKYVKMLKEEGWCDGFEDLYPIFRSGFIMGTEKVMEIVNSCHDEDKENS